MNWLPTEAPRAAPDPADPALQTVIVALPEDR